MRKGGSVQDRFSHGRSPVTRLPVPESQGLGLVAATRTMDVGDYAAHCYPMFSCHLSPFFVAREPGRVLVTDYNVMEQTQTEPEER